MLEHTSWETARDLLLEHVTRIGTENVPLEDCAGRILAMDLKAAEDVPPFNRSAYDGYALRSCDIVHASPGHPVTLRITETIPAGCQPEKPVSAGCAAHIMTGGPIPEGADCVINFERTVFTPEHVTLSCPLSAGANIVRRGEDVHAGDVLAPCGTRIDAGLAGTLAGQGMARVPVYRRPVAGIISTGSEIMEAGEALLPGRIYNSNRSSFTALLQQEGCDVRYLGLCPDDAGKICALIEKGLPECDLILLTGGVSVGDWDLTPRAMEMAGARMLLSGVDIKPGMACAYGVSGHTLILGLSGNPASSITNFCACALPALRYMAGHRNCMPTPIEAVCAEGFAKKSPSTRFLRGSVAFTGGRVMFHAAPGQGNAVLSSAIGCNAFCLIPAGSGPVRPGDVLSGFLI